MSLDLLKAEIDNDPANLGYEGKTASEVLSLLTSPTRSRVEPITSAELLAWAGGGADGGRFVKIRNASQVASPIQSVACVAIMLLERDGTTLDLTRPDRVMMVEALVQANVLSAADKSALYELATKPINRLQEIGLPEFHWGDVNYVINGLALPNQPNPTPE